MTALFNVPLNNALASVRSTEPGSESEWTRYLTRWTAWNHVRTAACTGAMALMILGLLTT